MRSISNKNQLNSLQVDSPLGYQFKSNTLNLNNDGLPQLKQSMLFQLNQEARFAKYKDKYIKTNNSMIDNSKEQPTPIQRSPSTKSGNNYSLLGVPKRTLSQFDEHKIELDKNIILPMPQVSINFLTKFKKPTQLKSEKRGSYDYIEIDKNKYQETIKYLTQQQILAAEREQRRGSIKLKNKMRGISTSIGKIQRMFSKNSPKNIRSDTPKINHVSDSPQNTTSYLKNQSFTNASLHFSNNEQDQAQQLQYQTPKHQLSQSMVNDGNEYRRSSFFQRNSIQKNLNNLFTDDGKTKLNSTFQQQQQYHSKRPSNILSTFFNNGNKDQSRQDETQYNELDTTASCKKGMDFTSLLRSKIGAKRRSSNLSYLSEDEKKKDRTNSFLFRGPEQIKQRQSFFGSIPYNAHLFEQIQKNSNEYSQEVIKNMTENKFLSDQNKLKEKKNNKDNTKIGSNSFKQFAINHFTPDSLERLKTFFQFAFTSVDKSDNKQITNALNELLENFNTEGTMQMIDLWSAKSLKQCIERTNMVTEKSVIQQFLFYKAKYDILKKVKQNKKSEVLSRQKEEQLKSQIHRQEQIKKQINSEIHKADGTFVLEDDDNTYTHSSKMLLSTSSFNLKYKNALNCIIDEIKEVRQENVEDIKNTNALDKILSQISKGLEKKYKFSKIQQK